MALPSEGDFDAPIGPEVERYLTTDTADARERVRLFRLAWDVACSAFGGRQVLYERFFGGDPTRNALLLYQQLQPGRGKGAGAGFPELRLIFSSVYPCPVSHRMRGVRQPFEYRTLRASPEPWPESRKVMVTKRTQPAITQPPYEEAEDDLSIEYPSSDGEPMAENKWQYVAMTDTTSALENHFIHRDDVFVAGSDLLIYYRMNDNATRVAPDVFVVFGAGKHLRDSWIVWREGQGAGLRDGGGVAQHLAARDAAEKRDIYAEMGVSEYWRFDPTGEHFTPELVGERLAGGEYHPITLDNGRRRHTARPQRRTEVGHLREAGTGTAPVRPGKRAVAAHPSGERGGVAGGGSRKAGGGRKKAAAAGAVAQVDLNLGKASKPVRG